MPIQAGLIKRTIEISRDPAHLAVQHDQLVILRPEQEIKHAARVPCEDIGVVLVDHPQVTYTHQALAKLMEFGAAVVVCGRNHLPAGLLIPLSSHSEVVWRINEQVEASKPTLKRLWQQIVTAKVRAQARNLEEGSRGRGMLMELAGEVKSGDTTNIEAQAARVYWGAWLTPGSESADRGLPYGRLASSVTAGMGSVDLDGKGFRRDPDGTDVLNAMLNYGYAVMRAAVGRALVSAGLFPALGIHHRHRSNAFALADDLVEPMRAMVDARVRSMWWEGRRVLDQTTKASLLELLTAMVLYEETTGPLMVSLHRYAASLVRCYQGESDRLSFPVVADD